MKTAQSGDINVSSGTWGVITKFDDNEFLRTFYCYNPNDFEGNELITRDDLILTSQYDYIFEMVERKSKLIDKYTKNLQERIEYNDEPFCNRCH